MRYVGYLLGPLGCALGMVVCMAMMARSHRRRATDPRPAQGEESRQSENSELDRERPAASDA